jgi:DNA-binding NarL/FixJ family response regulator
MRILVVDDHPLIQVALKHVLEELDDSLELFQAHDARAARSVLAVSPELDLILLDLTLPGCDGFEYLRELRRDCQDSGAHSVGDSRSRHHRIRARYGCDGFIPKTTNAQLPWRPCASFAAVFTFNRSAPSTSCGRDRWPNHRSWV